jgi:hypothetical protein
VSKSLGWILLVLGLVVAGYGVALLAGAALPTGGVSDRAAWGGALAVGLVFLVVALVLITRTPKLGPAAAPAPPPVPQPETVEVKRTEMRWGERPATQEAPETSELEGTRQQLARLKVQYGLGELSAESYRRLSEELEAKLAQLERAEMENH